LDILAKSYSREHVNIPEKSMTYTSSSNMINLDGPLIQIFLGFLLAIIGCVILISVPEYSQVSYLLFLIAGVLVALAMIFLAGD
jgi:hypothetical protein